jgi:hypothetical protein
MDHAFAGGATGGHHAARRGRGRPTGLSLTWTHAVGALVARSSKECPVRPCRAGSPYPASLGETAGSGDPALQQTASSRLRRNDSVDQGGTRRPGEFFDGKVQSPPGTAGSTVWRHGFSGKNLVRLHGSGLAGLRFGGQGLPRTPAVRGNSGGAPFGAQAGSPGRRIDPQSHRPVQARNSPPSVSPAWPRSSSRLSACRRG